MQLRPIIGWESQTYYPSMHSADNLSQHALQMCMSICMEVEIQIYGCRQPCTHTHICRLTCMIMYLCVQAYVQMCMCMCCVKEAPEAQNIGQADTVK